MVLSMKMSMRLIARNAFNISMKTPVRNKDIIEVYPQTYFVTIEINNAYISVVPIVVNGYAVGDAVKGNTSTSEVLKAISERLISQQGMAMVSLEDIEFGDSIVTEKDAGIIEQLHLIPIEKKQKPPSSPSREMVMHLSEAPIARVASVWNLDEEEMGQTVDSNDFQSVIYGRYHNVLSQLLGGLRLYASHSANRIDMQVTIVSTHTLHSNIIHTLDYENKTCMIKTCECCALKVVCTYVAWLRR